MISQHPYGYFAVGIRESGQLDNTWLSQTAVTTILRTEWRSHGWRFLPDVVCTVHVAVNNYSTPIALPQPTFNATLVTGYPGSTIEQVDYCVAY